MFLISKYAIHQRYKGTYKVPTEDSSRVEVLGKSLPGVCGVVRAAARGEEKSLVNKHGQTVARPLQAWRLRDGEENVHC